MFDLVLIQYLVKQSKRFQFINLDNLYILGKSSVLGWWRHLNLTEVQPKPILVQFNSREKFRAILIHLSLRRFLKWSLITNKNHWKMDQKLTRKNISLKLMWIKYWNRKDIA